MLKYTYGSIYISGQVTENSKEGAAVTLPAIWIDGKLRILLPDNRNRTEGRGTANAIIVRNKNIYVVGSVNSRAFLWMNNSVIYYKGLVAEDISIKDGSLYIIGLSNFDQPQNQCYPTLWINRCNNPLNLYTPFKGFTTDIYTSNSHTVVSGYYINSDLISIPCLWIDDKRIDLDSEYSVANSVCFYKENSAVAGTYWKGSYPQPCYWIDGTRSDLPVPPSVNLITGQTEEIFSVDSDLYISGYIGGRIPCYWKNSKYHELSYKHSGRASSIRVKNNTVFIVGSTSDRDGITIPCIWINGNREDLPIGEKGIAGKAVSIFID